MIVQEIKFLSPKKIVETDEVTKMNNDVLSEWEDDVEVKRRNRRKERRNRRGTIFGTGGLSLVKD